MCCSRRVAHVKIMLFTKCRSKSASNEHVLQTGVNIDSLA